MLKETTDTITFGKYKGETVEYIYYHDAQYLKWLVGKTDRTNFSLKFQKDIEIAASYEQSITIDNGGHYGADIGDDPNW